MTDSELAIYAMREAQLIISEYVQPGPRNCEATMNQLLSVLDRSDVVAAVGRLEEELGLRLIAE